MPIYDYECLNCGGHFEAIKGVEDKSLTCYACGTGIALRQTTGAPVIRINGYSEKNGYSKGGVK